MKDLLSTLALVLLAISLQAKDPEKYFGRHIITALAVANNTGPGFGVQYEHVRSNDKLSWVVPVYFCFSRVEPRLSRTSDEGKELRPVMFFISPGFRFYPARSSGIARYSIGANVIIGTGKGQSNTYVNYTNELVNRSITGICIANAVSFQITPHIRTGLELSLGIAEDNGLNAAAGPGTNPFGQFVFNLGYRF